MAKEQEVALNDAEVSEQSAKEQIEPQDKIREVLDARDFIEPLREVQDESLDGRETDNSNDPEGSAEQEIELSLAGEDFPMVNDRTNTAKEDLLRDDITMIDEAADHNDPPHDIPKVNDIPKEDGTDTDCTGNNKEELAGQDDSKIMTAEHKTESAAEEQRPEGLPEAEISDNDSKPKQKSHNGNSDKNVENDFVGLDEDELNVKPSAVSKIKPKSVPNAKATDGKAEKATAEKTKTETLAVNRKQEDPSKKPAEKSVKLSAAKGQSRINKTIIFALVVLVVAGLIFYCNPALIGLKKVSKPTPPTVHDAAQLAQLPAAQTAQPPAEQTVKTPLLPSQHDNLIAKIEEATDLREKLLEKKEEIYNLNLYYRNGIAELEENIYQEAQKEGINSFEHALKNKRIELNLRTIQRRLAYIQELEKPTHWVDCGSEELLYLIRKARLDLELIDIAGGIDVNKHKRHISAAIHQYRSSTDKLAINLQDQKLTPLETIWQQASNKDAKQSTNEQISLNNQDEKITTEICSGNLGRIAELTRISPDAARCLSRIKGSDLFLNGVTQLLPEAAKELFQWRGSWICLNGIKDLSPAAAQYLFKWKGDWISLNGLTEFPPGLAIYLLKWEGQQLELMGLKYNKTDAEQKTLKYLSLWETTGGKLFVSDEIRKQMNRVMVSQLQ